MRKTSSARDIVTRGGLAKEAGCNIETIRYYERIGLMPLPRRSASGYRLYGETGRRRLGFILRGRELGFTILELRSLLSLVDRGDYTCGEVRDLTLRHVAGVRRKIAALRRLERTLADVSARCDGADVPDCPIIDTLYSQDRAVSP